MDGSEKSEVEIETPLKASQNLGKEAATKILAKGGQAILDELKQKSK